MRSQFSLNDKDVRVIFNDATTSTDPSLLRSHIFRFVEYRKQMALAINALNAKNQDLLKMVDAARTILNEDRSTGLLGILANKQLITKLREQLEDQLRANVELVASNEKVRYELVNIQRSSGELPKLREQVKTLTHSLATLTAQHESTLVDLDAARYEKEVAEAAGQAMPVVSPELLATVENQQKQIESLNQQLSAARAELEAGQHHQRAEAAIQRADNSDDFAEVRQMFEGQVHSYLQMIQKLKGEARTREAALTELSGTVQSLQKELEEAERAVESERLISKGLQGKITELEDQLSSSHDQVNSYESALSESRIAEQTMRSQLSDMRDLLEESERQASSFQSELSELNQRLDSLKSELGSANQQNALLRQETTRLTGELQVSNQTVATQQTQIQALGETLDDRESTIQALTEKQSHLASSLAAKSNELNLANAANTDYQNRIESYVRQVDQITARLDETVSEFQQEQSQLNSVIAEQSGVIERANQHIAHLGKVNEKLSRELTDAQSKATHQFATIKGLHGVLKNISLERQRLQAIASHASLTMASSSLDNAELNKTVADLLRKVSALTSQLATSKKVIHLEGTGSRRDLIHEQQAIIEADLHVSLDNLGGSNEHSGMSN